MTRVKINWLRNPWYVLHTNFSDVDESQAQAFKNLLKGHGFEEIGIDYWQAPNEDEEVPVSLWAAIGTLPFETEMSPFFLPVGLRTKAFQMAKVEWVRA